MTPKGSRITVDLGDDELVKKVKIAAVQHGRTVREIVVEAMLDRGNLDLLDKLIVAEVDRNP